MKRIFLLLFILISYVNALEIDEYKTDVYFANGILTNEVNASSNTLLLKLELIKNRYGGNIKEYKGHIGKVTEAYNETHWLGLSDLFESFLQKIGIQENFDDLISLITLTLFETSHSRNLDTQITAYKNSIQSGHKVLVVAHSQGNLFTYEAREKLFFETNQGWMSDYFKVVSIASPAMFAIPGDTPLISWDNDLVAWLGVYNSSMVPNPIRKVEWEGINPDNSITAGVTFPESNYILDSQVGEVYGGEWKAVESILGKFDTVVHAFTFYMGEDLGEGKILNPFDGGTIHTDKAKNLIMNAIDQKITELEALPSQWNPKNIGCTCKDKYAKMTHKYDPDSMNQYLSDYKVKDFEEDAAGKIYKADEGDHAEYVRALDGYRSDDGIFTIESIEENGACYALKDDASNEIGRIEGSTEPIPKPQAGVVQVTLTWDNPAIDFDLNVGWDAGENDIQDTGCPMEHFYVASEYDIYPGTYPISVTHKQLDENESTLIPEKIQMIIQVPDKTEIYDIDIDTIEELEVGHVADIFVKYKDKKIAPDISPDPILTPVISIPTDDGNSSSGSLGGTGTMGSAGGGIHWRPIDNPSCNQSCGCIPCEYKIIPYLQQLLYGPISGADIALYEARDHQNKSPLYVGKTSAGYTLYTAGNIDIPDDIVNGLQDDTLYLLIARGGNDIDHNDDFEIDDIPTLNQGATHLLLSGKDIKEIGFKMNVLTEIAYQVTKEMIDVNATQEVQNKLNEVAQRLLKDKIYGDTTGGINYKDLSFWMPTIHKPLLIKEYNEYFRPLVDNLFANRDIYQEAHAIVYDHVNAVPTLQSIRLDINEDINSSIVIGKVPVLNKGASEITSFILEGDGSENFAIDANGEVCISENSHLDYERKTYYQLYVSAVNDDGVSEKVLLLIQLHNVVDAPEYQSFTAFTFYENAAVGTEVMQLLYNSGNSPLQSVQLIGKDSAYFRADIVGNTVSIKVNKTLLSYNTKRAYELQLQVSNLTDTTQSLPFTLIVSDRRDIPKLGYEWNLRVDENATAGTVVGKVKVISDGYSPIQYFKVVERDDPQNLFYEWPDGYFEIDQNGTIRVGEDASFDYEKRSDYSAYITAVNAIGESQKGFVRVYLNNIPDTLPNCQGDTIEIGPISKSILVESEVKNVYCYNGDSRLISAILDPNSPFEAVIIQGNYIGDDRVSVRVKDPLANTDSYEYNLSLSVVNAAGESNERLVHITIDKNSYIFEMHQGDLNKILGTINTGNKTVSYIRTDNGFFSIDKNGTVRRNDSENRGEYQPQYTFKVTITYDDWSIEETSVAVKVTNRILAQLSIPGKTSKVILNQAKDRAYITNDESHVHNNSRGLVIVNIEDPYHPQVISSMVTDGKSKDIILSKDENHIYLLDAGKGLKVVDISDESTPEVVASLAFSGKEYAFGGIDLSEDGTTLFMAHGDYGIEVIDVSDPFYPETIQNIGFLGNIEEDKEDGRTVGPGGYKDVIVDGTRLYSIDWTYGLQAIDINSLETPVNLYAESLREQGWGNCAINIYLNKEQHLISVLNEDFWPSTLYHIGKSGDIRKLKQNDTIDAIELLDQDIAYGTHYGFNVYDAYNPTEMTKILSLDLGQTYGMVLDKNRNTAFIANGEKGLTIIDLTGIEQPIGHNPVLAGNTVNIQEQNLSSITLDDVLGNVPILKTGDTPLLRLWTDQPRSESGGLDCGYYPLPKGENCENDYSYFNIDENGNIYINETKSLAYESIGNMAPFAVYAENENGHHSNQVKVMLNIIQNPDWTIQFQKPVIKIDSNISIDTTIANVIRRKSQRILWLFDIYKYVEYGCNTGYIQAYNKDQGYKYSYAEIIAEKCTKSDYFDINANGDITISETPPEGNYSVNIFAVDRFGLRGLNKLKIEVVAP